MNERLKEAFDKIRADDELKKHTREFLFRKTHGFNKGLFFSYRQAAIVAVCFMFVLFGWGGYSVYFTPTSAISVDVNPSIELSVNRFDKVIFVETYSEDGYAILPSMDIRFLDYRDALEHILAYENMAQYLTQDQVVAITVFGADEKKSDEMLTTLTLCMVSYANVHCSSASSEEVAAAHSAGMSFGKYKAFLELQALEPAITADDVKGLTMRQIWDMINELSSGMEDPAQNSDVSGGNGGQNSNHGNGYRNGSGNGNGHGYGDGNGQGWYQAQ